MVLSKVIRVKYEKGMFKPLDHVELPEGAELLIKIIDLEEKKRILRKYHGILGPAPKELLDKFMLEAEEQ
jgi:predicted DNA-binding antitoxin AbrB/MazE fold protein